MPPITSETASPLRNASAIFGSDFTAEVTNPWFPLRPGTTYLYTGKKDGQRAMDIYQVSHRTKRIDGVVTLSEFKSLVDGSTGNVLARQLTRLEGVASIESSFALEQVKYTNVLPVV